MGKRKVYKWDDENLPNISLLDKRVLWWNEEEICIKNGKMDKNKDKKELKKFFHRPKKEEFTQKLFKEFPELFKYKDDRMKSLMCFGVECGKGWYDLIYSLTKDIYEICKKYGKFIEVQQIKEKFGGLRYYTSAIPKEFAEKVLNIIQEAEDKSFKICEKCGKPGKIRTEGWHHTLCDKCQKDREIKRTNKIKSKSN